MDLLQIKFLQRLIADGPCSRDRGVAASHFQKAYALGTAWGRRIEYLADDIALAASLLEARGLPVTTNSDADRSRAGASCLPGISEKSGSLRPHLGEVAIKSLSRGCYFGDEEISYTLPGYVVMQADEAVGIVADGVLMVENLETFKQIDQYAHIWRPILAGKSIFALFRGDSFFRADFSAQVISKRSDQVWSFPDFDPAGLGLAAGLPRLSGLVLPWESIEKRAKTAQRRDLFEDQIGQWDALLDACDHADIARAWKILRDLRMGLPQEAMRRLL